MSLVDSQGIEQLVVFRVGADELGIPIHVVREIINETKLVRLPKMPSFVAGVLNLRGRVISVVDLGERLGLESEHNAQGSRKILIAARDDYQVGYLVNQVSEVLSVPESALEPPASSLGSVDRSLVSFMCKLDDRLFPVLNITELLGDGSPTKMIGNYRKADRGGSYAKES